MTAMYPVRLSRAKIDILKESILRIDPKAKVYLFGSRVDLHKKGGDIDILVLSETIKLKDIRSVRMVFFKEFGEQKLDILIDTPLASKIFTKIILEKAVLL